MRYQTRQPSFDKTVAAFRRPERCLVATEAICLTAVGSACFSITQGYCGSAPWARKGSQCEVTEGVRSVPMARKAEVLDNVIPLAPPRRAVFGRSEKRWAAGGTRLELPRHPHQIGEGSRREMSELRLLVMGFLLFAWISQTSDASADRFHGLPRQLKIRLP